METPLRPDVARSWFAEDIVMRIICKGLKFQNNSSLDSALLHPGEDVINLAEMGSFEDRFYFAIGGELQRLHQVSSCTNDRTSYSQAI